MPLQHKQILIIDDMKDIRYLVRTILESDGAEVIEAETVEQGLAYAQKRAPQLIITDLNMPVKTGFDFLREMRNHEILRQIPVIVLSGLNDRNSVLDAVDLGAKDYVIKPIKASVLLQKARKALHTRGFQSYEFKPEEMPSVTASLPAEVVGGNEVGLQIESFVKFAPNDGVKLSGDFIDRIGCTDVVSRTSNTISGYKAEGRYVTQVNFVGLSTDISKVIRTRLAEWK